MKYNYVSKIDSESGIVTMLLHGEIGSDISGAGFANELKNIVDYQSSLKKINLSINSPGGMVFDGYSIITAIEYAKQKGVEIDTHIDGLAASMAAVIAVNGDKVFCADYGSVMVHNPFDSEGECDESVTKIFKDSLVAIMSGKTGMPKDEMSDMMNKETWMTPKQAKSKKFVDEIKTTSRRLSIPANSTTSQIYAIYNNALKEENKQEEKTKNPNMKKIANILKLNENVSEEVIENSIQDLLNKISTSTSLIDTVTKERDELKVKVQNFEAAQAVALENEINELIEGAIKEGKIKDEDKEAYMGFAKVDLVNTKKVLGGIAKSKEGVDILDAAKAAGAVKNVVAGREKWNIRDWEKKDAKGLAELKKNTPEVYNEMYDAFYPSVIERQESKRV